MQTKCKELIEDLKERTNEVIKAAKTFEKLPIQTLQKKQADNSWSVLECLEHLNLYGDFYVPEIEQKMSDSKHKPTENFKSGLLGNYFAKIMLPGSKEMKTFNDKNPIGQDLSITTINRFLKQQDKMLMLLQMANNSNLTRVKTSISISKWIKLRLGDTLRVVIYHNQRHIEQAKRIIS